MRQPTFENLSDSVRTVSDVMERGRLKAVFSRCGHYRYTLSRQWDPTRPIVAFIGLNPSTADQTTNDPTVTRCIGYALRWKMGGYVMLNAYAFRATKPANMKAGRRFDDSPIVTDDPIGRLNDQAIRRVARVALDSGGLVIAAWGNHCDEARAEAVLSLIPDSVHCLGVNQSGSPKHPLYLKSAEEPRLYRHPWFVSIAGRIYESA